MSKDFWTTRQGERLEIRWMQTQHLVHSVNMVMRNTRLAKSDVTQITRTHMTPTNPFNTMISEIYRRERMIWQPNDQLAVVGARRETPVQLCMLRAILDTRATGSALFNDFNLDPDNTIAHILREPLCVDVAVKFAEYRLARP